MENNRRARKAQVVTLPTFVAVPVRIMRDRRPSGVDRCVLDCIQFHDRFSEYRGGAACWATVRTMAKETGLAHGTVANAVNRLISWGYVRAERRGKYRHLVVLFEPVLDQLKEAVSVHVPVDSSVHARMDKRRTTKEIAQKRSAAAEKAMAAGLKRCLESADHPEASHGARARQGTLR